MSDHRSTGAHLLLAAIAGIAVGCGARPLPSNPPVEPRAQASTVRSALLVVGNATLVPADAAIKARLESLGFAVAVKTDAAVAAADASGRDVVFISESVASAAIATRLRDVATPVVCSEPALWDEFAMTGVRWGTDAGDVFDRTSLFIAAPGHPLASDLRDEVAVLSAADKLVWARPAAGAQVIATLAPGDDRAAVFAFEHGAALVEMTAPARRVGFFLGRDAASRLTGQGWKLFDAAVLHAAQPRAWLVVGSVPLDQADAVLRSRIEAQGFVVDVKLSSAATSSDDVGHRLIVVSESSRSADIDDKYKASSVPILTLEPAISDELALTGPAWATDYGDLAGQRAFVMSSAIGALSAGLEGRVVVTTRDEKYVWAKPVASAIVAATIDGDPTRATVFGYDTAAPMFGGFAAPARRVFWGGGQVTTAALTPDGQALLDAAIRWAAGLEGRALSCAGVPDGTACSDGNDCNGAESCQAGECRASSERPNCDDGNVCTTGLCRVAGCEFEPRAAGTSCSDGNACNGEEVCSADGRCLAGTDLSCEAQAGACQEAACDPQVGCVVTPKMPGEICATGACTAGRCDVAGACVVDPTLSPLLCQVEPQLTCVHRTESAATAVFGYTNAAEVNVSSAGSVNSLTPATAKPPAWFEPGAHRVAFTAPLGATPVTWRVGDRQVTATREGAAPTCALETGRDGKVLAGTGELVFIEPQTIAAGASGFTAEGSLPALAGEASVNNDGSFSYRLPLWTPPGRNGIQPSLALQYSSRNIRGGMVGPGWSLTGFSRITRCNKTRRSTNRSDNDPGDWRAISFDQGDGFCYDGNAMFEVAPGEYRTRSTTFARIRADGGWVSPAMGPRRFVVETKDGRIWTYEPLASQGGQGAVLAWPLRKVADRFGNEMTITWVNFPDHYEEAPLRIEYTSNSRKGLEARRSVQFRYSTQAPKDQTDAAQGRLLRTVDDKPVPSAFVTRTTQQLDEVLMLVSWGAPGSPIVKKYQLGYETKSVSGRKLLTSIKECDGRNVCRPPLTFDWESGGRTDAFEFEQIDFSNVAANGLTVADANNDGLDDVALNSCGESRLMTNRGRPGFGTPTLLGQPTNSNYCRLRFDPVIIDMDRDGRPELVQVLSYPFVEQDPSSASSKPPKWAQAGEYHFHRMEFRGAVFEGLTPLGKLSQVNGFQEDPPSILFGDKDGDGIPDGFWQSEDRTFRRVNLDSSGAGLRPGDWVGSSLDAPKITDEDGDGRSELKNVWVNADGRPALLGTLTIDLNGDTLTDSINLDAPSLSIMGRGIDRIGAIVDGNYMDPGLRFADLDGDGVLEVLAPSDGNIVKAWDVSSTVTASRPLVLSGGSPVVSGPPDPTEFDFGDYKPEAGYRAFQTLDYDGDGLTDLVTTTKDGKLRVFRRIGEKPDVITAVTTGHGSRTSVSYRSINKVKATDQERDVYRASDCKNLVNAKGGLECVRRGMHVVAELKRDSGLDDANGQVSRVWRYTWENGRRDMESGAFVGFEKMVVETTDGGEDRVSTTEFYMGEPSRTPGQKWDFPAEFTRWGFPKAGQPWKHESKVKVLGSSDTWHVTRTTTEYEVALYDLGMSMLVRPTSITEEVDDATGPCSVERKTVTKLEHYPAATDPFGNLKRRIVTKGSGDGCRTNPVEHKTTELFTYWNNTSTWIGGRPRTTSTLLELPRERGRIQRFFRWEIDQTTGVVTKEERIPIVSTEREYLVTTYVRDELGNVRSTTVTGNGETRTSTIEYDPIEQMFPYAATNALGQRAETVAHPSTGAAVWTRDANGVITRQSYDGFFRPLVTEKATGDHVTMGYRPSTQAGTKLETVQVVAGGGTTLTRTDRLGREVLTSSRNSRRTWTTVAKTYDLFGRTQSESPPYEETIPGEAASPTYGRNRFVYDELARPTRVDNADGSWVITTYSDLVTTRMSSEIRVRVEERDDLGRVVRTSGGTGANSNQARMTFTYDPAGQLLTATNSSNHVTYVTYDPYGRRTSLTSPDSGTTSFVNNPFGEVIEETKPGNVVRRTKYDALGRVTEIADEDGTTRTTWDAAPHGLGLVAKTESPDGVVTTAAYDSKSRPVERSVEVDDHGFGPLGPSRHRYVTGTSYDGFNRVDVMTYPKAVLFGEDHVTQVRQVYDAVGALRALVEPGQEGAELWAVEERDEAGRRTRDRFGNGVTSTRSYDKRNGRLTSQTVNAVDGACFAQLAYEYDSTGNLLRRERTCGPDTGVERFAYDGLERLVAWYRPLPGQEGNQSQFVWKVGYAIDELSNVTARDVFEQNNANRVQHLVYHYEDPSRPHTVTGRSGLGSFVPYGYDGFGRQVDRGGTEVAYTSFDLPSRIGDEEASDATVFKYDAGGARVLKARGLGTTAQVSTTYVGGVYERRVGAGAISHVYYLVAGGNVVGQIVRTEDDPEGATTYFHGDHLGSVSWVSTATGFQTTYVDPYGNRLGSADGTPVLGIAVPPIVGVTKGFTGHEMEDELGLVNMNGRVFDPTLQRFLTPDPFVTDPMFGVTYNRYAYVRSNPLRYVDPTGFGEFDPVTGKDQGSGGLRLDMDNMTPAQVDTAINAFRHGVYAQHEDELNSMRNEVSNKWFAQNQQMCVAQQGVKGNQNGQPKPATDQKDGKVAAGPGQVDQATVLPDAEGPLRDRTKDAETALTVGYHIKKPTFNKRGRLTEVPKSDVNATIQTTFAPGVDPEAPSAYGRGATQEDVQAGNTSLRFHERQHAEDLRDFVRQNPLPRPEFRVGMTRKEFWREVDAFRARREAYVDQAMRHSEARTDCVEPRGPQCR